MNNYKKNMINNNKIMKNKIIKTNLNLEKNKTDINSKTIKIINK